MSKKPDKPETPEHEKIVMKHQARMGKEGNALAHKVGGRFVSQMTRDRLTNSRGRTSADVAIASKEAKKRMGGNVVKQAKGVATVSAVKGNQMVSSGTGAISESARAKSRGARQTVALSQDLTRGGLNIASIEQDKAMHKMEREFKRANEVVDLVGAVASQTVTQAPTGSQPFSEKGGMSVANPSGAQSSVIVNQNDPLSNPLPAQNFSYIGG